MIARFWFALLLGACVGGGSDRAETGDASAEAGLICAYFRTQTIACPDPARIEHRSAGFCEVEASDDCRDALPSDEDWQTRADG
jgi:hypothetical protein